MLLSLKNRSMTSSKRKVAALKTDIDDFHVHGRELYWLCKKEAKRIDFFQRGAGEDSGKPSTIRGMTTVQKIAAKH